MDSHQTEHVQKESLKDGFLDLSLCTLCLKQPFNTLLQHLMSLLTKVIQGEDAFIAIRVVLKVKLLLNSCFFQNLLSLSQRLVYLLSIILLSLRCLCLGVSCCVDSIEKLLECSLSSNVCHVFSRFNSRLKFVEFWTNALTNVLTNVLI